MFWGKKKKFNWLMRVRIIDLKEEEGGGGEQEKKKQRIDTNDVYWIVKNINDLFFFFASFVFSVFLIVRQYIACLKIWFNDIQGRRFFFSFFDCHTRCSYSCTVVWTVGNKNNVRCTRRSLLYIHYMAR